eukprot:scaffold1398_cov116-Cylindrotheca_fusiformis.AAC.22
MGDCLIRIVVSKQLVPTGEKDVSISRVYSSDTTIREVVEEADVLFQLYNSKAPFRLWDTTFSPPKDITSWPVKEFPDIQGQKSKTLHSAGFFPSGSWLALPPSVKPHEFKQTEYDDSQYNQREAIAGEQATGRRSVEFKDVALASSKPLPSQVMQSVVTRFDNDDVPINAEKAHELRRENHANRRKLEQERAAKLDQRIQNLEEKSNEKNKKVSEQVRRMLIKSRATGAKSLKQQDRLYFECLVDNGTDDLSKEYRFFSPQDTFAKIAMSFAPLKQSALKNEEILVKIDQMYQRFPAAMRVHEAISHGLLSSQINTIVIRWYGDDETPTETVKLNSNNEPSADREGEDPPTDESKMEGATTLNTDSTSPANRTVRDDHVLGELIQKVDSKENSGKKPKKKSAAALKVRNMQIKSKAKGDVKRIPKVDDRFFLEVILVSKSNEADLRTCFLAKKDPVERLLSVVADGTSNVSEWEFMVPTDDQYKFNIIADISISLREAEERQILKNFGRIILCQKR